MSTQVRNETITLETAEAIVRYQLLYINSSGKWAVATATSAAAVAVAADNAASGAPLAAVLLSGSGTLKMSASAAIAINAPVYQTAAGEISSTVTGGLVGIAMQAASADNDVIEVRIATPAEIVGIRPVLNLTADATLGECQSGATVTNLGAGATITVSLPTSCKAGTHFYFAPSAAQRIQVDPGASDGIYMNGVKNGDGKYMWADDEAESCLLVCNSANDWVAIGTVGTWTVEP